MDGRFGQFQEFPEFSCCNNLHGSPFYFFIEVVGRKELKECT